MQKHLLLLPRYSRGVYALERFVLVARTVIETGGKMSVSIAYPFNLQLFWS